MTHPYYLYMLRCCDDTIYTGITTDLQRRLATHNSGKGAKYTRGRTPLTLVYHETCQDHSAALRREIELKRLSRAEKLRLIALFQAEIPSLDIAQEGEN